MKSLSSLQPSTGRIVVIALSLSSLLLPATLFGQAATTQVWTGITPPPENGTSYTFAEIVGGTWDASTANWANAAPGTVTDYHAFTSGPGRIAAFLPKTAGYTVTLAYNTPTLRALSVSGGNTGGSLTIQSASAYRVTFNGTNSYISVAPDRTLTIGANTGLTGSHRLISGGTLIWSGAAEAFSGTIDANEMLWIVNSDAASRFGGSSVVNLNGASFFYNGATAYTSALTVNSGTLGGTGRFSTAVAIGGATTLAPGMGVGSQRYDSLAVNNALTYQWQLDSWQGTTAGSSYDLLDLGALSLDPGGSVVVNIQSLAGSGEEGALADFNAAQDRIWTLMSVEDGFDTGLLGIFSLDSSGFEALHDLQGGAFSLESDGSGVQLRYTTAIPEPGSVVLLLGAAAGALVICRRRE